MTDVSFNDTLGVKIKKHSTFIIDFFTAEIPLCSFMQIFNKSSECFCITKKFVICDVNLIGLFGNSFPYWRSKKGGSLMANELSDERRKAQIMVSYAMENITKETLGNISQNKLDTCRAKINFIY